MANEVEVRLGTPYDVDGMMKLAISACEENGVLEPNTYDLLQDIWPALNLDKGMAGVIGPIGGELEGAVLLRIGRLWYSENQILEEKAIFIPEHFRKAAGQRARRLCEFSKSISDRLELPLMIGVLSNSRTEGKVRLYRRIFGEPAGAYFLYNAKTGNWKDNPADTAITEEITEH